MDDQELNKGDDVTYSEKGIAALNPRRKNRVATVKGFSMNGQLAYVRWFGTITNVIIHKSFITKF